MSFSLSFPALKLPSNISLRLGPRHVTPIQGQLEVLVINEKREVTSWVSDLERVEMLLL